MNCFPLVVPPTHLKGIGDEPLTPVSEAAAVIAHKSRGVSLRGAKIDQHVSFPKGLPVAFHLKNEYLKD